MSAADGPGRAYRLCVECGATTDITDRSLTCPSCYSANFEEVREPAPAGAPPGAADPPPGGQAGAPPAAARPASRPAAPPAPGAADRAAASLLPPGERWLLVIFHVDGRAWELQIAPGDEVELGRDPGYSRYAADLAADDTVSRCHAVIGLDPDGSPWIRDVGSANGTAVNDLRLPRQPNSSPGGPVKYPLRNGDRLRLGLGTAGKVGFIPRPEAASQA